MSAINLLQQECVRFLRRTYTPFRCRAPCRGRCVLRTRWGAALPKPLAHPRKRNTRLRLFLFCGSGIVSARLVLTLKTQI